MLDHPLVRRLVALILLAIALSTLALGLIKPIVRDTLAFRAEKAHLHSRFESYALQAARLEALKDRQQALAAHLSGSASHAVGTAQEIAVLAQKAGLNQSPAGGTRAGQTTLRLEGTLPEFDGFLLSLSKSQTGALIAGLELRSNLEPNSVTADLHILSLEEERTDG